MKTLSFLILITRSPVGDESGLLGLDAALAAAAFDQEVTVLFKDEGVFQLLSSQNETSLGNKNMLPQFALMQLYGVQHVWVAKSALQTLCVAPEALAHNPTVVTDAQIDQAFSRAHHVWVY